METLADIDATPGRPTMTRDAGGETDFLKRIDHHAGIVRKVAVSYARSAADRHDLEQEILAQLWKSYPRYDGRRPFATWMYRVALNVAISIARAQRGREAGSAPLDEDHAAIGGEDAGAADREQGVRELMRFIGGLDELNRALILLYLDGHNYREIAEVLGITETNVATKINRVKQTLRARMNPEENDRGTR